MRRSYPRALSIVLTLALLFGMIGFGGIDSVYAASKKIHISEKIVSLTVGSTYQQKLINKNGKKIKATKVKWKSKNKTVATINKKGKITAVNAGTAKMTAKYKGKTYKFTVKVAAKAAPTPSPSPSPSYRSMHIDDLRFYSSGSLEYKIRYDDNNEMVITDGYADVKIKQGSKVLYEKNNLDIRTNGGPSSPNIWYYYCWLEEDEIEKTTSEYGTIEITLRLDDGTVLSQTASTSNLPYIGVTIISAEQVPFVINGKVQFNKLECRTYGTWLYLDYEGEILANTSEYAYFKLLDSEGYVLQNTIINLDTGTKGEKFKKTASFVLDSRLKRGEVYTIVLYIR